MMKNLLFTLCLLFCGATVFGQGLLFDGQDDYLSVCHDENFNVGDGFTVEAWIFANEWRVESWRGSIVSKDNSEISGFVFRCGDNGSLSLAIGTEQGVWPEVLSDPIMNLNQWYHVAAVVDGENMFLYINGGLVESASFTQTPSHNTTTLDIGRSAGFPGRFFDGLIDEVRIWDVARTPNEINDNQTTAFTGTEPGLVAYLPMNEASGLTTANLVDNNCGASFMNMNEQAWSENYSIPDFDLGVISVNAPDVLSIYQRPVNVNVTLQNFGAEAATNVPIEVAINGIPTLTGVYEGTIQPGETAEYTFPTPVDLRSNNTNLIQASTAYNDDTNGINDATDYRYRKPDNDLTLLRLLNEEPHNFGSAGQIRFTDVNIPENMEDYSQLLLHFSVECPSGGCDPWDQPANFSVINDEGEFEIARFVTPFGIECGDWTVDVTDFKSLLAGNITLRSFIQVWGQSGWLLNAELEFIGNDAPSYQKVSPLWQTQYHVYGDPSVMDDDLPTLEASLIDHTETAHMRMTITGHGQGNTDNAAEFSNKTHQIFVNGQLEGTHNLWKDDCNQNACANQNGTWLFARAGWCPGQQVEPFIFDLNDLTTPGGSFNIDYELEDYTNLENTGYNDSNHTEPHYRIASYVIESSSQAYETFTNLRARQVALLTSGTPDNPSFDGVSFTFTNTGTEAVGNIMVAYYVNNDLIAEEMISSSVAAGDTYVHDFATVDGFTAGEDHTIFAVVSAANDNNLSDDVIGAYVDDQLVNINELDQLSARVFPNPNAGQFRVTFGEELLDGTLEVVDVNGRVLQRRGINNLTQDVQLDTPGMYVLRLRATDGRLAVHKVIVE